MSDQRSSDEYNPDEMRAAPKTGRDDPEPNEMTTWDGAGNPVRDVFTDNAEGRLAEGTGDTAEEARKDAEADGKVLGEDAGPEGH
ncbi:MAG: hypothetical protein M3507_08860 [Actinomycetota bacterium]|nr:hypothetical protein [Actinomycetota bacterium]